MRGQKHSFTVPAGGVREISGLQDDFLNVYQLDGEVTFQVNRQGDDLWLRQGQTWSRGPGDELLRHVKIRNDQGVAIGVKLLTGTGLLIDGHTPDTFDQFEAIAHVDVVTATTTLLAAADANRSELVISNLAANGASVFLGGATLAVDEGLELVPGASVSLATRAAVYCYHAAGVNQSVGLSEARR